MASSHTSTSRNPSETQRRRRSSSVKSAQKPAKAAIVNNTGAASGLTAHGSTLSVPPASRTPQDGLDMSLSRSPSPRTGGGWSSPGLTSPFDTLSGRSSPRKAYGDLHINGGPVHNGVTWASAKARSEEVNGYPSFSTRNNGFFLRHARKLSSSLPRFNLGNRTYAEKEKLGRGRTYPFGWSKLSRLKIFLGSITRRMRLQILLLFAIMLSVVLFYTTRKFLGSSQISLLTFGKHYI